MILPAPPDVLAAAHRLRGVIQRTPCTSSAALSTRSGVEAFIKEHFWEPDHEKIRLEHQAQYRKHV